MRCASASCVLMQEGVLSPTRDRSCGRPTRVGGGDMSAERGRNSSPLRGTAQGPCRSVVGPASLSRDLLVSYTCIAEYYALSFAHCARFLSARPT